MVLTYAQIDSCKAILRERIQELQAEAIGDRAPLGRAMLERSEDARAMWRVLDWLETIHLAPRGEQPPAALQQKMP